MIRLDEIVAKNGKFMYSGCFFEEHEDVYDFSDMAYKLDTGDGEIIEYTWIDMANLLRSNKIYGQIRNNALPIWFFSPWSREAVYARDYLSFLEYRTINQFRDEYGEEYSSKMHGIMFDDGYNRLCDNYRFAIDFRRPEQIDNVSLSLDFVIDSAKVGKTFVSMLGTKKEYAFSLSNIVDYILRQSSSVLWMNNNLLAVPRCVDKGYDLNDIYIFVYKYDNKFLKAVLSCSG